MRASTPPVGYFLLTCCATRADHAFFNIHKELHNPFGGRALDIAHEKFMGGLHHSVVHAWPQLATHAVCAPITPPWRLAVSRLPLLSALQLCVGPRLFL